jgi:hypothetical protein
MISSIAAHATGAQKSTFHTGSSTFGIDVTKSAKPASTVPICETVPVMTRPSRLSRARARSVGRLDRGSFLVEAYSSRPPVSAWTP